MLLVFIPQIDWIQPPGTGTEPSNNDNLIACALRYQNPVRGPTMAETSSVQYGLSRRESPQRFVLFAGKHRILPYRSTAATEDDMQEQEDR